MAGAVLAAFAATTPPSPAAPRSAPEWRALTLVEGRSTHPASAFAPRADGALVIAGEGADKETYTLELDGLPARVTALRLDVLPDPALPGGGPGRQHKDMVLTEVVASLGPKGGKRARPLALQKPSASWSQEGYPALGPIDGVPTTGWAIGPKFDQPHHWVAELQKPADVAAGEVLTLELQFQFGGHTAAGCVKLSATDAAPPVRAEGASEDVDWSAVQPRINGAIDRGVQWLLSEQLLDGSWDIDQTGYRNGGTALMVYALLKSGVPKDHPAIERALEWMKCGRTLETYSLGCLLLALNAMNDPTVEPWMKELLEALLKNQLPSGAFRYSPTNGGSDLSNAQYGVLGLRAAAQRGIKVPAEAFEKAAQYALSTLDDAGGGAYSPLGFRYHPGGVATGSMTTAGAAILAIADEQLRGKSRLGGLLGQAKRGGEWIGQNFAVDGNPRAGGEWTYYYLYGLERLGALLQTEEFGGRRWYREGARWLVDRQEAKGAWPPLGAGAYGSTAWALLFLNRATAASSGKSSRSVKAWGADDPNQPLSLRASGDSPITFWISSFGAAELEAYEWPGEKGRGLRVQQVEWIAFGIAGRDDGKVVATIARDPGQPCGKKRFGGQHKFELPGDYSLLARLTLMAPAHGDSPAAPLALESSLLTVQVTEVQDPVVLEYSRDPRKNLLTQQKPNATASTQWDDHWAAARAVDGLLARGWCCKGEDRQPKLLLELEKAVRANVLLLTPLRVGADRPWPAKVKVTLNGKAPAHELVIEPPDGDRPNRKVRLVLPMPQVIRKIELEVTAFSDGAPQPAGCGFAEVELQMEQNAKR